MRDLKSCAANRRGRESGGCGRPGGLQTAELLFHQNSCSTREIIAYDLTDRSRDEDSGFGRKRIDNSAIANLEITLSSFRAHCRTTWVALALEVVRIVWLYVPGRYHRGDCDSNR
jgi:hypothetical protein